MFGLCSPRVRFSFIHSTPRNIGYGFASLLSNGLENSFNHQQVSLVAVWFVANLERLQSGQNHFRSNPK